MDQKPSIGRIVHFYEGESAEPCAAIITVVWSDTCVNLQVFTREGTVIPRTSVASSAGANPRWSWPPRV